MTRLTPTSTLFPYTTLFRSRFKGPELSAIFRVNVDGTGLERLTNYRLNASHPDVDRKSTRLNSSHLVISYAVFCLKKKKIENVKKHAQQIVTYLIKNRTRHT